MLEGQHSLQKAKLCHKFKMGSCDRGKNCNFSHVDKSRGEDILKKSGTGEIEYAASFPFHPLSNQDTSPRNLSLPYLSQGECLLPSHEKRQLYTLIRDNSGVSVSNLKALYKKKYHQDFPQYKASLCELLHAVSEIFLLKDETANETYCFVPNPNPIKISSTQSLQGILPLEDLPPGVHVPSPAPDETLLSLLSPLSPPLLSSLLVHNTNQTKTLFPEQLLSLDLSGVQIVPEQLLVPANNFLCTICQVNVITTPKVLPCSHFFCAECIDQWGKRYYTDTEFRNWASVAANNEKALGAKSAPCPMCSIPASVSSVVTVNSSSIAPYNVLYELIRGLPVCCVYKDCVWRGSVGLYKQHALSCVYRMNGERDLDKEREERGEREEREEREGVVCWEEKELDRWRVGFLQGKGVESGGESGGEKILSWERSYWEEAMEKSLWIKERERKGREGEGGWEKGGGGKVAVGMRRNFAEGLVAQGKKVFQVATSFVVSGGSGGQVGGMGVERSVSETGEGREGGACYLSLRHGDIVHVVSQLENGWAFGRRLDLGEMGEETGWFPFYLCELGTQITSPFLRLPVADLDDNFDVSVGCLGRVWRVDVDIKNLMERHMSLLSPAVGDGLRVFAIHSSHQFLYAQIVETDLHHQNLIGAHGWISAANVRILS